MIVYQAELPVKPLPKVIIVDDDPAVLSSIEALLAAQSYEVLCFASAQDFIAQHDPTHVGCVLFDLSAATTDGSDLIQHLHETQSLLSVVIISGLIGSTLPHPHGAEPVSILARAYEVWVFLTMIEDAVAGSLKRGRISTSVDSNPVDPLDRYTVNVLLRDKILKLSPRQRDVLSYLLAGDTQKEVAHKLELSEHTVGDYVKQIYKHFSVSSRAQLLALFITGGQS